MGFLDALGGEAGCRRLSEQFYARVGKDPELKPLFPGKSLRCATNEFASFLIQFLGGDEEQTQHRWWLSLRESHARFNISPAQRAAWLKHMRATVDSAPLDGRTREALHHFFLHTSSYVTGKDSAGPEHLELADRWQQQRNLDETIAAIRRGNFQRVVELAPHFADRPSVFVGLLARMLQTGHPVFVTYAIRAIAEQPSLTESRFFGRTLLHYAAAAGSVEAVALLLRLGMDPNIKDGGSHTPLYSVANQCALESGAEVVRILVEAGADVRACDGVTRATPLHMAARRGSVGIARALLDLGADPEVRDRKGDTPLQRARNCRKVEVAELLKSAQRK